MNWQQLAIDHAERDKPREACGLLVVVNGRERYFPCRNISSEPDTFVIHPDDWVKAEDQGFISGVFHSHVGESAKPSETDIKFANLMTASWHIYATESGNWETYYPPKSEKDLLGREWIWRHQDCGTLAIDWYRQHGINISDYKRPATIKEHVKNSVYFDQFLQRNQFQEQAKESKWVYGDLLVFAPNGINSHVGIYVGNQTLIHHEIGKLSTKEMINKQLLKILSKRLRHLEFAKIKKE